MKPLAAFTHPAEMVEYITQLYVDETGAQKELRNENAATDQPIFINPMEGKMLQLLCAMVQPKSILEIGTLHGYSTTWLAKTGAAITTLEKDAKRAAIARDNFLKNNVSNIELLQGDANVSLESLEGRIFDIIFIDADKRSYSHYATWAKRHVRKGGLVIADNTLLGGSVYATNLPENVRQNTCNDMQAFNQEMANDNQFITMLFPTEDGLTVALKK